MCLAVSISLPDLPTELATGLADRVYRRGGEPEVQFHWRAYPSLLPVWADGRLQIVRWGNRDRADRALPPTGWTWRESVEQGKWRTLAPEDVEVPAGFALMGGVWFKLKQGLRGLLVRDGRGRSTAYVVCEPATRYYRVMTRADWMPCLIGEVI